MGLEGVTPREGHLQNLGHSKDISLSPTVDPSTLQGLGSLWVRRAAVLAGRIWHQSVM